MYRKRRKIRYYNGPTSRERLTAKPWFPYAVVALAALALALILGAILGSIADGDKKFYPKKDLLDLGGAEDTDKNFAAVTPLQGDSLSLAGKDNGDIRSALSDLSFGDTVVSVLYDGQGNVYYDSELPSSAVSVKEKSQVTLDGFAERAADKGRISVGVFVTTAFRETDEAVRIVKKAEEMAILSEIARSAFDELVVVGLPTSAELAVEVNAYVRSAAALLDGKMSLAVAVDGTGAASDTARLVAASEAYADRLVLDLRGLADTALSSAVEKNAYYVTYYRMCVLFDSADDAALLDAYEGLGKLLVEKIF